MQTYTVRVWDLQRKDKPSGTRWVVRWSVDGQQHSKTFAQKGLADSYRSQLMTASRNGQSFDTGTGEPSGTAGRGGPTCYEVARQMVAAKWSQSRATSRRTEVDNLAYLLVHLIPENRTAPAHLRRALRDSLAHGTHHLEPQAVDALRWLEGASLPVASVTKKDVGRVLKNVGSRVRISANEDEDRSEYSDTIRRQRRTYLSSLFTFALAHDYVSSNPVKAVKRSDSIEHKSGARSVSPRQIGDLDKARSVISAIANPLHADFARVMLMAGLRPEEVAALRVEDCNLPATGWGSLYLTRSAAVAGTAWTDTQEVRDEGPLKHRATGAFRDVPIPPSLVDVLRARIGNRTSGRVFTDARGALVNDSALGRSWARAREKAGIAGEELRRMYDLRHLAASLWLNAGVPVVEVASRLGHSAQVCFNTYAHVVHTERTRWNIVIESAIQ